MANVDAVKSKVQEFLVSNLNNVGLTKDGFTIRNGSAQIFVSVRQWGDKDTLVKFEVPVLFDVPRSPELYEYIAFHASDWVFGTIGLNASDEDPGKVVITLEHSLQGDYLDEPELMEAVRLLAQIGDKIDDELKSQFGGTRFHEDD
ncbi:hypothetical protein GOARA_013_00320 [Gordonia araii NBRC 100433]|uniref:TY-Chap central domain-containing protein n=2 Tax=Gordonia TaxID=2053 RepID=A0A7M4BQ02_9ACTN|nr:MULTISPECIES: hypothetical protein [Gordonia]NNG97414.1 hypothetical protein [Gordonia araii NBRC 100433]GAB08588.1 hypothetical protein GOARA_013_00320 [Gordonia araii NBRC 100433]GED95963.1 hypothetical protein nbrc107697_00020 [Gordonia crocea]